MSVDSDIVGAVHAKVRHDSARGHVTGQAKYIDDMPMLPGTLEVVLVTSPHPHAGIVSIDVAKARAADGVRAVLSADDIPGANSIGPVFDGEPALAQDIVDYVGAPVVAVAADTYDQARAAAALVAVEYDVRPPVLDIERRSSRNSIPIRRKS
jgi:xanthine dehydrogenase large subunit